MTPMTSHANRWTVLGTVALGLALGALHGLIDEARAQATPPAAGQPKGQVPPSAGPAAGAAKKSSTPKADATSAATGTGSESGLKQRVETLEEQLVDLQVVIGTLESLAKTGGGGAAASSAAPAWRGGGAASASDSARIDGIETQIRALTAQIEQLSAQVRQGQTSGQGVSGSAAIGGKRPDVTGSRVPEPAVAGGFGSTTVTPGSAIGQNDPIGGLIGGQSVGGPGGAPEQVRPPTAAGPLPPAFATVSDAGAKQLYETAYGHLLQQDYGAAEVAFDDFLKRYPSDALAGNAQYWLGESHYVRGQYKAAAGAFLKGYQTFGKSSKAPDSLLKLAMSLDRLGQKDAACSSYGELTVKYPNAPAHVKSRAQSERQRIGCT